MIYYKLFILELIPNYACILIQSIFNSCYHQKKKNLQSILAFSIFDQHRTLKSAWPSHIGFTITHTAVPPIYTPFSIISGT